MVGLLQCCFLKVDSEICIKQTRLDTQLVSS